MSRIGHQPRRPVAGASGSPALGTITAYVAAIAAFTYALISLYWAVGGRGLVSTVGGYVEQFAHRGGAIPVLVALAATGRRWLAACSRSRWSVRGGEWSRAGGCWPVPPQPVHCWSSTALSMWPLAPWSCQVSFILGEVWTVQRCAGT